MPPFNVVARVPRAVLFRGRDGWRSRPHFHLAARRNPAPPTQPPLLQVSDHARIISVSEYEVQMKY